jgi:cytochrome c-type biogenesis protein CcmH
MSRLFLDIARYASKSRKQIAARVTTAAIVTAFGVAAVPTPAVAESQPAAAPKTNLADIEDEVMCPICGTTLGLSESPQAQREKDFIQRLIAEGKTKDEVKAALVAEYGQEVLAVPSDSGFDLAAWIVPAAGLLLAAIAIILGLRRWRRSTAAEPTPLPDGDLDTDAEQRLDADLARYDL